jgi:hypothetical protein
MKTFNRSEIPWEEYKKIELNLISTIYELIKEASTKDIQSLFETFKEDHYYSEKSIELAVNNLRDNYPTIKSNYDSLLSKIYDLANLTSGNKDSLVRFGENHELNVAHLFENEKVVEEISGIAVKILAESQSDWSI